ncbi:Hypothetical predicted protein [Olea europaea subsp. europaea]|uniref:E3 ubiquitin protein ligase n=1 Tax=Olea europaea subsp. europaea TaxID=158383 RepID=A0A8S0SKY3_OLEEU|nr:Hypothetical predicted protein [Olea europaea subsp. europaea]
MNSVSHGDAMESIPTVMEDESDDSSQNGRGMRIKKMTLILQSSFKNPEKRRKLHNVDAAVLQYQNQVDATVLQYQNQKLGQQSELFEDLILLGIMLILLEIPTLSVGSIPSCPLEDIFLCRLLQRNSIPRDGANGSINYIKKALASRQASTRGLMKLLEDAIDALRDKLEDIAQALQGNQSAEDVIFQLHKLNDLMKEEAGHLHEGIDVLHLKHKQYADEIQTCFNNHSVDQSEIKRLAGELKESIAELEESRRKLINQKMQKIRASGVQVPPVPVLGVANGLCLLKSLQIRLSG